MVSQAQEPETTPESGQQEVQLFPNWDNFSLESLGTFTESGQIGYTAYRYPKYRRHIY